MSAQKSVYKLGFWSAVFASIFSIAYVIGQLAEWFDLMGSGGGPENDSTWYGLVILLVPSLFLGISFVVMMGCVHSHAPADRKIWSQTGLAFAIMYGTLICMNYFVQLTLVAPALYRGEVSDHIRPFLFNVFNSFTYSVDLLGYSFMSLSTLFAAFIFAGAGLEKAVRWFFIANGLIMPFIALQTFYHPLIWGASAWAVTLPGATVALAAFFKRKLR
ncbi:MAG TPA: hypothetical protein PKW76_15635 [bacterium]|jgi:hypothetical protein|nr:hypothetical protein [bacterium]HPG47108.1 hypothetical protein [bacterium]HPM99568.1 hypothetical protein [bacterium]